MSLNQPNPCWVPVGDKDGQMASLRTQEGDALVFTTQAFAEEFMLKLSKKRQDIEAKQMTWSEFVDLINSRPTPATMALIDHKGEDGFYQRVPISKEDLYTFEL